MTMPTRSMRAALLVAVAALGACDLDVSNPQVIDADTFDPNADAGTLSLSAQTNFYNAFGDAVVRGAFFAGEAWVGATRQETNDFGRRVITSANLDINPTLWSPLSLAIASSEKVVDVLEDAAGAASNIHLARSYMTSAYSLLLMAEHFCEGVMLVGPLMQPDETLDSAIVRFQRAIPIADAAGGAEADRILNAARVGLARAYLQQGDYTNAAAAAADVPADFEFHALHVDDAASRGRTGNPVYALTLSNSFVAAGAFHELGDPRVPTRDEGRLAQDGRLQFISQQKYTDFGADIRIASGLEARYIIAEAELQQGSSAAALALIAERRAVGGQDAFTGTGDAAILAELMNQRARDFWLEGKMMGDYRRNPDAAPFVPAAGTPFYKDNQGTFGDLTCIPVPNEEREANPNIG